MAGNFCNIREAAEMLGIPEDEAKRLHQDRKLHGYRDGSDWKFKVDDVKRIAEDLAYEARQKATAKPEEPPARDETEDDVLLSEVELGRSDPGASGTIIGMESDEDADIVMDSGPSLANSGVDLDESPQSSGEPTDVDSKVAQFEELDLTLDQDLPFDDSQVGPAQEPPETAAAESALDLDGGLEDDDLVLGGSGTGSDITIGGDSGISLVDPSDSGLSLEEPLDLTGSDAESLELGEDDMVSLPEASGADLAAGASGDDFTLTPLEDVGEIEDAQSGSQVIALDNEGDESSTMLAGSSEGGMAAMLEEDLGEQSGLEGTGEMGFAPMGDQPAGFPEGAPLSAPSAAFPEMPYSIWNVLSLALCVLFLCLAGMFTYDLLRNMWSWDAPFELNSSMMDTILSWFE